jgi:hypothetical protein
MFAWRTSSRLFSPSPRSRNGKVGLESPVTSSPFSDSRGRRSVSLPSLANPPRIFVFCFLEEGGWLRSSARGLSSLEDGNGSFTKPWCRWRRHLVRCVKCAFKSAEDDDQGIAGISWLPSWKASWTSSSIFASRGKASSPSVSGEESRSNSEAWNSGRAKSDQSHPEEKY